MVAYAWGRRAVRIGVRIFLLGCISGCASVQGGPDRLYSVDEEVSTARALLEGTDTTPSLVTQYYAVSLASPTGEAERKALRNEIIARRMYVIDVEYSQYEANLTSERQKAGFAATTAAAGLGVASSLTEPVRSAQILSGVAAGILGAKGAYDSEVVIAKTLQIVQGYMRAARDTVAARQILPRLNDSTVVYPLSAALHDLEDYYRAGTFTAGLIPALRDSGGAADDAANEKASVVAFGPDRATALLRAYLVPSGKLDMTRVRSVNACLAKFQLRINILDYMTRGDSTGISARARAIQCAKDDPSFSQ